jgi:hypothetical protein
MPLSGKLIEDQQAMPRRLTPDRQTGEPRLRASTRE